MARQGATETLLDVVQPTNALATTISLHHLCAQTASMEWMVRKGSTLWAPLYLPGASGASVKAHHA